MQIVGLIFVAGMIFMAVGGAAFAAYTVLNPSRTSSDRLRDLTGNDKVKLEKQPEAVDKVAERLAALASTDDEEEKQKQRMRMVQAGFTNRNALEVFNATRVIMAIGLPVILGPILLGSQGMLIMMGGVLGMAAAGYYVPALLIDSRVTTRQQALLRPFPDAMDLLVSSVEAGLGLDAAFRRIADELEQAAPELAREFQYVNKEISTGIPRVEALRHLSARTGLEEINSLVNMLAQADRFGTSIAKAMRIHASMLRGKRMAKAEEEAAKVSPKLTVVMILFLMPCLGMVLLGPACIAIKNNLMK